MPLFTKRKRKEPVSPVKASACQNEACILKKLETYSVMLKEAEQDETVTLMRKIAECYTELGRIDEAIDYYEKCLTHSGALGSVHSELLKLYNIKMKMHAKSKDSKAVQFYLDKIDRLMKLSKDTIRGLSSS